MLRVFLMDGRQLASVPLEEVREANGKVRGLGELAESSAFVPAGTSHPTFDISHPAVVGLGSRSF